MYRPLLPDDHRKHYFRCFFCYSLCYRYRKFQRVYLYLRRRRFCRSKDAVRCRWPATNATNSATILAGAGATDLASCADGLFYAMTRGVKAEGIGSDHANSVKMEVWLGKI